MGSAHNADVKREDSIASDRLKEIDSVLAAIASDNYTPKLDYQGNPLSKEAEIAELKDQRESVVTKGTEHHASSTMEIYGTTIQVSTSRFDKRGDLNSTALISTPDGGKSGAAADTIEGVITVMDNGNFFSVMDTSLAYTINSALEKTLTGKFTEEEAQKLSIAQDLLRASVKDMPEGALTLDEEQQQRVTKAYDDLKEVASKGL